MCPLTGAATPPWEIYPFAAGCDPAVDFGTLAIGVPATEILAFHHLGRRDPLTVTAIAIVGISGQADVFTLSFFLASGGGAPSAAGLPITLDPPDEDTGVPSQILYVQIDFDGSANPFPADQLSITSDDETNPTRVIDVLGSLSDCEAGLLDCDGDPGNGCEVDVSDPTTCGVTCAGLVDCGLELEYQSNLLVGVPEGNECAFEPAGDRGGNMKGAHVRIAGGKMTGKLIAASADLYVERDLKLTKE